MGFLRKYVEKAAQPNLHEWHQEATEAWRGTLLQVIRLFNGLFKQPNLHEWHQEATEVAWYVTICY